MFVERNNYLVKLYDNRKKKEKEIQKTKLEVDNDLEMICNIKKYYKLINEALIIISEVEEKSNNEWTGK
jgi:hypothetical protein